MEKKYFVVSVGQPGKDYDDENLQRCLDNSCFVLNEYNKQKGVIQQIAVGDILI